MGLRATNQVLFDSPNVPVFGQVDRNRHELRAAIIDLHEDLDGVVGDGQRPLHAQPAKYGQNRPQEPGAPESIPAPFLIPPRCHGSYIIFDGCKNFQA